MRTIIVFQKQKCGYYRKKDKIKKMWSHTAHVTTFLSTLTSNVNEVDLLTRDGNLTHLNTTS